MQPNWCGNFVFQFCSCTLQRQVLTMVSLLVGDDVPVSLHPAEFCIPLPSFPRRPGNPDKKRRLSEAIAAVTVELQEDHADVKTYKSFDEHVRFDACGGFKKCARCHWEKHRTVWQRRLSQHTAPFKFPIVERPANLGGVWSIGCTVCAQFIRYLKLYHNKPEKCYQFAHFTAGMTRPTMRFGNIENHLNSKFHKQAMDHFLNPRRKDEQDDVMPFACESQLSHVGVC